MAKNTVKEELRKKREKQRARRLRPNAFNLGMTNVLIMMIGLVVIFIGYMLLGKGSITAAPILLVVGYCVIIPLAIVYRKKKVESIDEQLRKQSDDRPAVGE